MGDYFDKCPPESIDIFTVDSDHLETVAGECLLQVIALQIIGWVSGDGDVIVIDDDLYVQVLCSGQSSRLGVVTFLLRAIGAKTVDGLVAIGKRDTIDQGPQMPETAGREFDARGESELRVTGKFRVGRAILQEVFCGEVALQRCEEILCRDAMAWGGASATEKSRDKDDHRPASSKTTG